MRRSFFAGVAVLLLSASLLAQQAGQPLKIIPKLEPIAETKLIMEGLAFPNFRALEKQLKEKPADVQAWTFARGQALLIAETANLMMLRPPKNQGQAVWFDHAMQLRKSASQLATDLGSQDFERSRQGLSALANYCNRCHQSFRVPVEISAFAELSPSSKP